MWNLGAAGLLALLALARTTAAAADPVALWPLTDKYDDPVRDITGNGHDGKMIGLSPYGQPFPDTDTKGYRFPGQQHSYVEIPNDGLTFTSFTFVGYVYHEADAWESLFEWDPENNIHGTHIWAAGAQQVLFRPTSPTGALYTPVYTPGLAIRQWVRVMVSYNHATGHALMCTNDACNNRNVGSANKPINTNPVIRVGLRQGDARAYTGQLACLALFDQSFDDINDVDFDTLEKTCFNFNSMCKLNKSPGTGSSTLTRFYFNDVTSKCEEFQYKGNGGNANNFNSKDACEAKCAAFLPAKPVGLWPFTDKYDHPEADLSGNNYDAKIFGAHLYGPVFPGTDTKAYRLTGQKESYIEIADVGFPADSYTIVVYLFHEDDAWSPIFMWDPSAKWGTHIWTAAGQRLYLCPTNAVGSPYSTAYQSGLTMRKWVRVALAYNFETGYAKMCTDDDCVDRNMGIAGRYHNTEGAIHIGVHRNMADARYYKGKVACLAYFDKYVDDIHSIDYDGMEEKCFHFNDFCKLSKSDGSGRESVKRFFFNSNTKACEQFTYAGEGGNKNNFGSKAKCEEECSAFFPAKPDALWPLTDKYDDPVADISGNGHDAKMFNMATGFGHFPDSGTRAYRFAGKGDSYVEIPNQNLDSGSYTLVMHVKNEVANWAQLWAWDPQGIYGTHIWAAGTQIYYRPTNAAGGLLPNAYQPGLDINKWIRVVISHNMATGWVRICNNDNCGEHNLNIAGQYHNTGAVIRLGVHKGINDNRFLKGEMACVAYFDRAFDDLNDIDYDGLSSKCFDINGFCKLVMSEGTGNDASFRYFFDTDTQKCQEFVYYGKDGNENNFATLAECEKICHNYLAAEPLALWPLTDRYPNPVKDITGNGHDGVSHNLELGDEYPGTGTHVYKFKGNANSYVEVPNNGLALKEFTYVAYVKTTLNVDGPLFSWDPAGKYGTHIWYLAGQRLFMRPVAPSGTLYSAASHAGLILNKFVRVHVAYSMARGIAVMCNAEQCAEFNLGTAGLDHNTEAIIRMGARLGQTDARYFHGELACAALYDDFIPDTTKIDYAAQEKKCFGLKRVSSCWCWGDPHCQQFDKAWVHHQGSCSYTLSRDHCEDGAPVGDPTFEVIIDNKRDTLHSPVSIVREVTVKLHNYDLVVKMFQLRKVTVNEKEIVGSPYSANDDVIINVSPSNVMLLVKDGIKVTFDGNWRVDVEITSTMLGKTCGLCGNANGVSTDDLIIGPSDQCMDKYPDAVPGQPTSDVNIFGESWTAVIDDDPSCALDCPRPPPPGECTEDTHEKAKEHCAPLRDANGPFGECLKKMPKAQIDEMFHSCIFDACMMNDYDTTICSLGLTMSLACNDDYNMKISWRTEEFCPLDCPAGMVFKTCGNPCLPTCSDLDGENCGDVEAGTCEEGCFCQPHLVYDGDKCVDKTACGCRVPDDDVVLQVGESFVTQDCSQTCSCEEAGGDLSCTDMQCGPNEECSTKEGERGCHCEPPNLLFDGECRHETFACLLPVDRGSGDASITRFRFKREKCKCVGFDYKGTGGNENNFATEAECSTFCSHVRPPDECFLPKDRAVCGEDVENPPEKQWKFFYNSEGRRCKKMKYFGCGGNKNRFDTKLACREFCKSC